MGETVSLDEAAQQRAERAMQALMDGRPDEAHELLIALDDASLETLRDHALPELYAELKAMALTIGRRERRRRAVERMAAQERIALAAVRRAIEHRRASS